MEIGRIGVTQLNDGGNSICNSITYCLDVVELDR